MTQAPTRRPSSSSLSSPSSWIPPVICRTRLSKYSWVEEIPEKLPCISPATPLTLAITITCHLWKIAFWLLSCSFNSLYIPIIYEKWVVAQKLKTGAKRSVLPLSPMYGIIHVVMLGSQKHISHKHVAADECVTLHILLGCNSLRVWYSSKRLQFPICCVGDIACCVVNYWVHWCYIFSHFGTIRPTMYSTFICWTFRDKYLMLQAYIRSFKTSHQDRNKISEIGRFPALQYASADERVPDTVAVY